MAAARDEPLSKEEQEEEEMRNELISTGFFYENMDAEEMRMVVNTLKKAKGTSSQNAEVAPTSPPLNEPTKPMQSTSEASEHSSDRPIPNFSYGQAETSGNLTAQSTSNEEQFDNKEKSPDSTLTKSYGKNLNNENNSPESEPIFEKNSNLNTDDFPILGSKSNLRSNSTFDISKLRPRENKKPTAAMIKRANLERWKLNPLQFVEDKNDVPLKQPERLHSQQEEYLPYSNEEIDSDTYEELCQQMSAKLDSLHEQIIPDLLARERKSLWGSPIKASTQWNDTADKNSFVGKTSVLSSHSPDVSVRDNYERATKRKALCTIAAATQNDSIDENSDDEFVNTKKRKCQQEKKAEEVAKKRQESQESKTSANPVEMIEVEETKNFSDPEIFNNSNLQSLRKTSKTKTSINAESIESESMYPRRITPPNPTKKSFKGPRQKKKNATQSQNNSIKKNDCLNDEEINKTLNALDKEIEDNDCIEITDEIKPSPISKNMQKKINMARSHLENVRDANEQKIKVEEEARKERENEEKLKKDELISKRLQEEEDEKSRKLEKEKKCNEQGSFYNNVLGSQKSRVTRSNFNKPPLNYAEIDEDLLLEGDDDDEPMITHTNLVTKSCPICQKSFPDDQIESHASECELFSSELDEIIQNQPSTSHYRSGNYNECHICNIYKTHDGRRFEEHVVKCKEKAEDRNRNAIYV